ncbi:MAG TPA: hypothetical protein DCO79_13400, partial [Spirochaeta sp.]|nr:hypothetical protein [Spirochaeta sp.]
MTRRKMMLSAAGLFTIIAVFFLNSCAPRYELTVTGLSGGSVSIEPSGGAYKEGEVVTLTAIPDSGHSFTGWGNISNFSADNEIGREVEIIMPAENLDISVNFSIPSDGWTFMVYMAGDNSLSNQVYYDLDEIEQGLYDAVQAGNSFLAEDVQVLVLTDRSGSDDTKLFRVLPDSDNTEIVSSVIEYGNYSSSSELNMADPDTLQDFVSYGFAKYPSQYNALVLWNHGGGVKSLDNSELISKEICED